MGEPTPDDQESFDENHINIKLPKRCRRCHTYNEDPDSPTLQESFVILLNKMMQSPKSICFLFALALPYIAFTGVSVVLFVFTGHYTLAMSLFHCGILLSILWIGFIRHAGRRNIKQFSAEQDLNALNSSVIIHS